MAYNNTKRFARKLTLDAVNADGNTADSSSLAVPDDKPDTSQTAQTDLASEDKADINQTATTDPVTSLKALMDDAYSQLENYGSFSFSKQKEIDDLFKKYNEREFSFDINKDELYNMYKDRFTEKARLASEDAMGRAAAMTGGYGNSYAQGVGSMAYNNVMDGLDDKGLELYNAAFQRYKQEGQDILGKISALDTQKSDEKELWKEGYDELFNKYASAYNNYQDYFDRKEAAEQDYFDRKEAAEKEEADWYAANTWYPTGVIDIDTGNVTYVNDNGERATFGADINPHTKSVNPDLKYNDNEKYSNDLITRSYQPTTVVEPGGKRSKLTFPDGGLEYNVYGNVWEPIFVSDSGKYYVWNDRNNGYDTIPKEKYEKLWREQHPGSPLPDKKGSQGTQPRNYVPYKISEGVNGSY